MIESIAKPWLSLQCQMIPGVTTGVISTCSPGEDGLAPAACWPEGVSPPTELTAAGALAMSKRSAIVQSQAADPAPGNKVPMVMAYPLLRDNQLFGVVALQFAKLDQTQQQAALQLLQWGSVLLEFMLKQNTGPDVAGRLATVIETTMAALRQPRFQSAATAAVSHLAQTFDCERVSIVFVHRHQVHVRAISNAAQIDRRSNLIRDIEAAMEEALDEGRAVVYPNPGETHATLAHERLSRRQDSEAICTVPLCDDHHTFGALTFERSNNPGFDPATVELCDAVATLFGPVIEMKRLDDRSILSKVGDTFSTLMKHLFGPRHPGTKLAAVLLIALVGFSCFATGVHRVAASAALEGTVHQALVAPIDGYIKTAEVRAGDIVNHDDLLAELDDADLKLERRKWASQLDEIRRQHRRAVAKFDRAQAKILAAQLGKSEAELALIDEQLKRTQIIAPFDGVIVTGDLSHSLGAPVQRGQVLFELAPLDSYRMVLEVGEADIANVNPGQHGQLVLAAMPGEHFSFVVEQIIGIANADQGRNVFRVEARLEGASEKIRPGMKGVGKISIGERRLAWVWTHNLVDRVGLWVWSHLP